MIGTKVREERYIGDPDTLNRLLTDLSDKGELVAVTMPVAVSNPIGGEPAFLVVAQVRDPLPAPADEAKGVTAKLAAWRRAAWEWLVRNRVPIAITVAVVAAVAVVGYLLYLLVQLIVTHLALIIGALIGVVAVWFALGRAGVCPGLHCPGCRHH